MAQVIKRREGETLIQFMLRHAGKFELQSEVLTWFWREIRTGTSTHDAVYYALLEWDILFLSQDCACGGQDGCLNCGGSGEIVDSCELCPECGKGDGGCVECS